MNDAVPTNTIAHLHDEGYRRAVRAPLIGHESLIAMGGRQGRSLAGRWAFTLDPFEEGLRQGWVRDCHEPLAGRTEPWDSDIHDGVSIEVPGVWALADDRWMHYEGLAWFGRWLEAAPGGGAERLFLRVGAAHYEALVFLNGRFLGRHLGGSTPFFVELTGRLTGRDFLHIAVDNRPADDRVPMRHIDWFNYGGLFREVELVRLPSLFIRDLFVRLDGATGHPRVDITLSDAADGAASIEIPELGLAGSIPIREGRGGGVLALTGTPLERWRPDRPRLYEVTAGFGADRVTERVGFRTLAIRDGRVHLNGERVFLKGIGVHEDDVRRGRVTDDADIRRRLTDARDLGCNFLRLAHYPHHERVAQLADEVGLMLWAEIPVYWAIDFADPAVAADATNQLVELIVRDRNRASVIAWGVGNETADSDGRLHFMSGLVETAREWDPSRLVGAACLVNKTARRIEDRLAAHLDLVGINEYYGWYDPDPEDLLAIDAACDIPGALIITESGADGLAGFDGDTATLGSLAHQADYFRRKAEIWAGMGKLAGLCPWLLYDFRTMRRWNSRQGGFNRKGLIAADKQTRKPAFDVYRAFRKDGGTGDD